jgi:hypothetical protein
MTNPLRIAVALVLTTALIAASTVVAGATADPSPPTDTPPLNPRAAQVAIELTRTSRDLAEVERRLDITRQELASAQSAVDVTDGFIHSYQPTIDRARALVKATAVTAYTRHTSAASAALSISNVGSLDRGDRYLVATSAVDTQDLEELLALQDALRRARDARAGVRDDLAAKQAELEASSTELGDRRSKDQALLDAWGAVPVMGDAWLTADQLAAWYHSTGASPNLAAGTTIEDLARFYIEEGQAEGVRGDLAFAQGVVESAYFSVAVGNNYSGIGACDSCSRGFSFQSPRDGVRAQIQLLRNYADPDSRAANLKYQPVKGLYPEDQVAAAHAYDSFFLKGKAPLWNLMGSGNWATDTGYAQKIVELFARIVAYSSGT